MAQTTMEFLLAQRERYPALQPTDLLKALHQSVFGCGHLIEDAAGTLARLRQELAALPPETEGPEVEPLDGGFCRLHLRFLQRSGMSPETLFRLFQLSAAEPAGSRALLEEKLRCLPELAEALHVSREELRQAVEAWRQAGYPACRHSEAFRQEYAPAYRVIRQEYVWLLPLLAAIDRTLAKQSRVLAALEGGSAAGKTTLASLLAQVYDCNVFHMDDFFLRPEQRTEARYAEPGGNVDRERFYQEVLLPLTQGEPVSYRPYDCHTQTLRTAVTLPPKALNLVEGAYCMHPALAGCYDLAAFLRIDPETQRQRILRRNDPADQERFFSAWIPLERRYFAAMDPMGRCDLILEVTP